MSFFDKMTDAAKQAKQALDEVRDVLDADNGRATAAESSQTGTVAAGAGDSPGTGHEPPLSLEEVNEISGIEFDHFYDGDVTEEWASRTFTFSDPSVSTYFELRTAQAPEGEAFDPDGMWEFLTNEVTPREPVDGIAPGAFRSAPDTIYFRVGHLVMHTVAHLPENTGPLVEALATRAAANARSL